MNPEPKHGSAGVPPGSTKVAAASPPLIIPASAIDQAADDLLNEILDQIGQDPDQTIDI